MSYTPDGEQGKRRYGQWAGNPKGHKEDMHACVEQIYPASGYIACQCSRKRGHGPRAEYCKQHAKLYVSQ